MKKITLLFPLFILLLLSACRDDFEGNSTSTLNPDDPIIQNYTPDDQPVNGDVNGQVIDDNNRPVTNAMVQIGNQTVMTNDYGLFSFTSARLNQKGTFITVDANGYFKGSRRFFPREGKENKVVIQMIEKNPTEQFASTAGGTVSIDGGATVDFPANSIVDADGNVYDGMVYAASVWLDPTAAETFNRMPGNLQGVRDNLEEVTLQTFGMINLELSDANGAPLQVRDEYMATITMPIPSQLTSAPDEIPLWHFSETHGIWVEDGSATKVNGTYVGDVSHFTWWNCDAPFPLIELDLTLVDMDGNPLSYYGVGVGFETDSSTWNYSYTDSTGFVSGKVPQDEALTLFIRGFCHEILATVNIGSFSEDTSLGQITVEASEVNNTTVSGTLMDCNGNPLTNGGVIVRIDNYSDQILLINNGSFEHSFSTCISIDDVVLIGLNFDENLETTPQNITVGITNDLGDITVCDQPITESYMTLNVDGNVFQYFGNNNFYVNSTAANSSTNISYSYNDSLSQTYTNLFLGFGGVVPGDYSTDNYIEVIFDNYTNPNYPISIQGTGTSSDFNNFNVTLSDDEKVAGTFSGTLTNTTTGGVTEEVEVEGEFYIFK